MTLSITDMTISSDVTHHSATRITPLSWCVTWHPDQRLDRNGAITAMTIAEIVADPAPFGQEISSDAVIRSFVAELELGLTLAEVKRMVTELLPGTSEVHDTHAIPADDEPAVTKVAVEFIESTGRYVARAYLADGSLRTSVNPGATGNPMTEAVLLAAEFGFDSAEITAPATWWAESATCANCGHLITRSAHCRTWRHSRSPYCDATLSVAATPATTSRADAAAPLARLGDTYAAGGTL